MTEKRNVGQATASLVLGILSFLFFGLLAAIPAVICGHVAQSKIRKSPDSLTGEGKALTGLIMGYMVIGFSVLIIPMLMAIAIPSFHKARTTACEKACQNNMRILESAKAMYGIENNLSNGSTVSEEDLEPYLKNGMEDVICPEGGAYTLNPIGEYPDCTIHDYPY
ncbi:MAG: DUF4190 domain-containing protein [Pontiellaceae bacterium]|nr:DUF4190 domain-containing protein [Pontiellaceae bacterium]MBN2783553.1 DUF4190 domain-containing protein [Pontiellaceae bacterium]